MSRRAVYIVTFDLSQDLDEKVAEGLSSAAKKVKTLLAFFLFTSITYLHQARTIHTMHPFVQKQYDIYLTPPPPTQSHIPTHTHIFCL